MISSNFYLIGYDPIVSHLLAGIAMLVLGVGLKNDFVDYSVIPKISVTCLILSKKIFLSYYKTLISNILFQKPVPLFKSLLLGNCIAQMEICSRNVQLDKMYCLYVVECGGGSK